MLVRFTLFCVLLAGNVIAHPNIFNANDPIINYNPANPPAIPPVNTMAKWIRTFVSAGWGWSTDKFKCYYWNGMAFRLRFPNGFNPADASKKYPAIVFFHGDGEVSPVTDNEFQLVHGAYQFQAKIDSGLFNAFLLFPEEAQPGWDISFLVKVNNVLDSLRKYCYVDEDRIIPMGLSIGGNAALRFAALFPQRSSTVISSDGPFPTELYLGVSLIQTQNNYIHIPLWLASGGLDTRPYPDSVRKFVDSFAAKGGSIKYNLYPNIGHGTWYTQWSESYVKTDGSVESYLVKYWNAAHKANPLVFYQRNQYCPDSINARIGITAGYFQYQWQKDNVDIPGAVFNEISATDYGSYRVRFMRVAGGPWSDWSPNPVVI